MHIVQPNNPTNKGTGAQSCKSHHILSMQIHNACSVYSDIGRQLPPDGWRLVFLSDGRCRAFVCTIKLADDRVPQAHSTTEFSTSRHLDTSFFLYGDRRCSNAYNFKSKQHKIISLIQQDSLMLYGGQTQFLVQSAANVSHRAVENVAAARVITWHQLWDSIAGCPSCELHAVQCPTVFIYTYFAVCTEAGYTMPNLQITCI